MLRGPGDLSMSDTTKCPQQCVHASQAFEATVWAVILMPI